MMKRMLLSLIIMVGSSVVWADEGFGVCSYGKETISSVICYGPAILKGTTVTGNIKVVGPLTARQVIAKSLTVTGTADVQDTQIAQDVEITGYLYAANSHFYKNLYVQADKVNLSKTIVSGNVQMDSTATKPYLTLRCGTSVTGSVKFGGLTGIVQVSDDSALQGKIHNGIREFIRVKC